MDFSIGDLLSGAKRMFVGLQGKKSNGYHEDITTNDKGALNVTFATSLDKDIDSINVAKMDKGGVTAFTGISTTTTTPEIDCRGYNAVKVWIEISGSGEWKITLKDSATSGGTFVDAYNGSSKMEISSISTSRSMVFHGVGDYVKIEATETSDGSTCVIKVQPLNV